MKKSEKPRYNLWQNTGFMLRQAYKSYKSVPVINAKIRVSQQRGKRS